MKTKEKIEQTYKMMKRIEEQVVRMNLYFELEKNFEDFEEFLLINYNLLEEIYCNEYNKYDKHEPLEDHIEEIKGDWNRKLDLFRICNSEIESLEDHYKEQAHKFLFLRELERYELEQEKTEI